MLKALAFSGVLAATLVFSLGGSGRGSDQTTSQNMTAPVPTLADNQAAAEKPEASSLPPAAKKTVATGSNVPARKAVSAASKDAKKTAGATGKSQVAQIAKAPQKSATPAQPAATEKSAPLILASKTPIAQDLYFQCLELGNLLRREQCKWQVCSGKWGQDGCPSYKQNDVEVNY